MGSVELGQREQTTAPPHQAYDTMLGDGEILPSRSLSLAAVGLLLFAPYIYLESHNQYADIRRMFQLGGVQLHSPQADVLSSPGRASQWLATRWTVQNMQIPQPCTTYQYVFNSQLEGGTTGGQQQLCELSRTWPGDQLIPFFKLVGNAPRHLVTQIQTFSSGPQHYDWGSLKLVTFSSVGTSRITLQTANGSKIISLSTSVVNAPASK